MQHETVMHLRGLLSGQAIGELEFAMPHPFDVRGRASGFRLHFPAMLKLPFERVSALGATRTPILRSIVLTLRAPEGWDGAEKEVGRAGIEGVFVSGEQVQGHRVDVVWRGSAEEMAFYNKARNGRPPRIKFTLSAECEVLNEPTFSRSKPFLVVGELVVDYPHEAWQEMLRTAQLSESVLVETPFASKPPAPEWEPVWKHLVDARKSFDQGGETGWKNAVASIREALTEWAKFQTPDTSEKDPQKRTKAQRLDHLRQALYFANVGPHFPSEVVDRDDAVLALNLLAALIAERKP